ncbi:hypothetical protein HZB01_02830 [Candidatus Woesearchaeota archaeon]|nr:hypothetical protein [Candidatus Woesearchaeota archaeon]
MTLPNQRYEVAPYTFQPSANVPLITIAETRVYNLGKEARPINHIFISDFGYDYSAATLAGAATVAFHENYLRGSLSYLNHTVLQPYLSFDIKGAIPRFKQDLETILDRHPSKDPIAVTYVVDPAKDRKNIVTEWRYNNQRVYIAHPDHGQISALLDEMGSLQSPWKLLGAVEIDITKTTPDPEIVSEVYQLWDGHARYAPAAVAAVLRRNLQSVGTPVSTLRK